ncbi:MAG: molybdopterin molybdotransferase MoeA [Sphingobium sp.]
MSLLPVAEAQARLLDLAQPLPTEEAPLRDALNRWTVQDVGALRSQPSADLSAMDGYAVRHADLPGPWKVIGESAAGTSFNAKVQASEAVRIYTGASVPAGADTVVVQEDITRDGNTITLSGDDPGAPDKHVRKAGSDFSEGQCVIPSGTRLSPQNLALAALAGYGALPMPRKPRIALISTGSELVLPGQTVGDGQLPSSNAIMLQTMLAGLPCEPIDLGIIVDDLPTLTDCFSDLRDHDIIVTTGGASVGDHDLVRPALEAAGGAINFWKIQMRPGKPLICGRIGNALFLGLPGNPVSAFVTATLFLLPLVRKMAGCRQPLPTFEEAVLTEAMPQVGGRDVYIRAVATKRKVEPLGMQDSAATLALSRANCLIRRPANSAAATAGDTVEILRI